MATQVKTVALAAASTGTFIFNKPLSNCSACREILLSLLARQLGTVPLVARLELALDAVARTMVAPAPATLEQLAIAEWMD